MEKLFVLWHTGSKVTVDEMVIPYIHNSIKQGWFDEVHVMVWGDAQKLLASDNLIKLDVEAMIFDGVKMTACKACANNLCVIDELESVGIDVVYTGQLLTEYIKDSSFHKITF